MFDNEDSVFWMNGILARNCVEIRHDLAAIDEPGFWVVIGTFEGEWSCARFANTTHEPLPEIASKWEGVKTQWNSSLNKSEYISYVKKIQELIAQGWVYQVNACRVLKAEFLSQEKFGLLSLFHLMQKGNPAPHAAYLNLPDISIASASPELFLHLDSINESGIKKRIVKTSPIKGTSTTPHFGEKDQAENIMIVDLMRNDIARVSRVGSVEVTRLLAVEEHPGLFHLVSDVEGELLPELRLSQVLASLTPAGSISGAPKSSAVKTIMSSEEVRRGPYCGIFGWVEADKAELSVGIRLFWDERDGFLRFGTGAGITWGSDPLSEWEETELKAARLIAIASDEFSFHNEDKITS